MGFDVDHITQMITAVALAYIAYQNHTGNKRSRENDEKIVKATQENKVKIEEVGASVNGVLVAAKAETKAANDERLAERITAARAEGVLEGKAER